MGLDVLFTSISRSRSCLIAHLAWSGIAVTARLVKHISMIFVKINKKMLLVLRNHVLHLCTIWRPERWKWCFRASRFQIFLGGGGAGFEIATHWSPMRPKIEHWRLTFQNWSPAGDSRHKSTLFLERPRIIRKEFRKSMATRVLSDN